VSELEGRVEVTAVSPQGGARLDLLALGRLPGLAELTRSAAPCLWKDGDAAAELGRALGAPGATGALLLALRSADAVPKVLVLLDCPEPSCRDLGVAEAFASAAGACLAQARLAREASVHASRQAALMRAAMSL